MTKVAKYKAGDVLKFTNAENGKSFTVILIKRWDRKDYQRVAWLYKEYPNGVIEYAAPEEEFSVL
jgi:hypothetical protein